MTAPGISNATLERVLRDLHHKHKWLNTVIEGLESSMMSPHHKLINRAMESFTEQGDRFPKVDLGENRQDELEQLAMAAARGKRGRARVRRAAAA